MHKRILMASIAAALALCCILPAAAQVELPYDQTIDAVYGEAKGHKLYVDLFVSNGKGRVAYLKPGDAGKGLGIVDVASGAWNSNRGKIGDQEAAGVFKILAARSYTVFAIRPGSLPGFTALEMVENVKTGIRWVKEHAAEYDVDPDRLGLMGASAGGHLATLTMTMAEPGDPDAKDPLMRHSTNVKAVGAFFPPTDFIDWDGKPADMSSRPNLFFNDGLEGKSEEAVQEMAARISPALQVKGRKMPPLMLFHGTADPLVPLQQSQRMVEVMREAGNDVELLIKEGGGHPWITIPEEVLILTDWFDKQLRR